MLIPPLCITFCFLVDRSFICNIVLLSSSEQWFSNMYMYIHSFSDISIKGYSNLPLQGAWVQSLVEKRSCMLHSSVKIRKWKWVTKNKNRITTWSSSPTSAPLLAKTIIPKDKCTPLFIAAMFIIAKMWKQPKCPLKN